MFVTTPAPRIIAGNAIPLFDLLYGQRNADCVNHNNLLWGNIDSKSVRFEKLLKIGNIIFFHTLNILLNKKFVGFYKEKVTKNTEVVN